ncbi:MAG: photosystem II manganese-stabilizing polypeptide, partial [Pseudanabaena sp. M007S1SP1A06QC]|nr:photosystem II manganese-stabilizing polypeptide [Pseudanabaena sp. M007S1SP1A06QC]
MKFRSFTKAIFTLCISLCMLVASGVFANTTFAAVPPGLTYDQIVNTGLANKCGDILGTSRGGRNFIPIGVGQSVEITDLCLEPTSFYVKEESNNKRKKPEFVASKLMTRSTSSLDFVKATVTGNSDGSLSLVETDGLDYQPITVKMPGGELVAILFTIKGYKATTNPGVNGLTTSVDFVGTTDVPTYRGSGFIDPKGRGLAIGYDAAEALPAKRNAFDNRSVKDDSTSKGTLSLQIAKLNADTGEIAGTFETEQTSDNDLGGVEPKEVIIRGV